MYRKKHINEEYIYIYIYIYINTTNHNSRTHKPSKQALVKAKELRRSVVEYPPSSSETVYVEKTHVSCGRNQIHGRGHGKYVYHIVEHIGKVVDVAVGVHNHGLVEDVIAGRIATSIYTRIVQAKVAEVCKTGLAAIGR